MISVCGTDASVPFFLKVKCNETIKKRVEKRSSTRKDLGPGARSENNTFHDEWTASVCLCYVGDASMPVMAEHPPKKKTCQNNNV